MVERVREVLEENFPEIDFDSSDELVDDGIIDSLSIVGMISALSEEFGVTFPYEEIVPENFNSLESIAELIERYQ